jgi:hypothetical protein
MADELLKHNLDRLFDPGPDFPPRHLLPQTIARIRGEAGTVRPPKRFFVPPRFPDAVIKAVAVVLTICVVVVAAAAFLVIHDLNAPAPGNQPRGASYHPVLTFTNWVWDPKVVNGPEPGYRPAFTGLTSADVSSATAALDATGTTWVVDVRFTQRGAQLFSALTKANVAACPGDPASTATANCPQRHLTIWLDLTQTDLDNWHDYAYVAQVSALFDLKCLARKPAQAICPKFVSDPITLTEIDGGRMQIAGGFGEQDAQALASALNARTR